MDAKKQIRGFVCGGIDGSIGAVSKKIKRKKTDKKNTQKWNKDVEHKQSIFKKETSKIISKCEITKQKTWIIFK